jgi:hypothetical protein
MVNIAKQRYGILTTPFWGMALWRKPLLAVAECPISLGKMEQASRDGNCARLSVGKNPIRVGFVLHFIPMGILLGQKLCPMGKWAWV